MAAQGVEMKKHHRGPSISLQLRWGKREKRLSDHIQTEENNEALSLWFHDEGTMRGKRIDDGEVAEQLPRKVRSWTLREH